jgi:hypothetical protein
MYSCIAFKNLTSSSSRDVRVMLSSKLKLTTSCYLLGSSVPAICHSSLKGNSRGVLRHSEPPPHI